jgi:general secretion pathway protein J
MRHARGFTLLELIVAMMIFSIVIVAAYGLFNAGRGLSARAEARALLFQTGRAALQAIEEDLRGAVLSGSVFDTGLIGVNRDGESGPLDKIEFVAVNSFTAGENREKKIDLSKVTWWIEESHGLVRERLKLLTSTRASRDDEEEVEEVSREVVFLDFRYYDGQWKESWDSTRLRRLPKAIEVTVHVQGLWRDEQVIEKFTTRFYLPIGAETPEKQP